MPGMASASRSRKPFSLCCMPRRPPSQVGGSIPQAVPPPRPAASSYNGQGPASLPPRTARSVMRAKRSLRPIVMVVVLLGLVAGRAVGAVGGPDALGYTWADSDEPGVRAEVPDFEPQDLRWQGFAGDDAVFQIPLPANV